MIPVAVTTVPHAFCGIIPAMVEKYGLSNMPGLSR
jgi:hypothetical protein